MEDPKYSDPTATHTARYGSRAVRGHPEHGHGAVVVTAVKEVVTKCPAQHSEGVDIEERDPAVRAPGNSSSARRRRSGREYAAGAWPDAAFARGPASRVRKALDRDLWFLTLFLLSAVGLPLLYLDQPLHFDEAIFLAIGKQIAVGDTLYVDVADHKPPGIYLLAGALYRLFGDPVVVARLLTYGVTAVSGLLVVRLGRDFCSRRAAQGAGVLFVVMSYLPHFDGFYFLSEPYVLLTLLVAALLLRLETPLANAVVGVALAVGVAFNQTVFLFGATIILFHVIRYRYPEHRRREAVVNAATQIGTIGVGFLGTMAVVATALLSQGLLERTFYYSIIVPLTNYSTPFNLWGHVLALGTLLPVWLLAGGVVLLTGLSVVRGDRVNDRLLFVVLWAGVLSLPGATGFSGDHKFLFAFPAIALLAVVGVVWLFRATARYRPQLRGIRDEPPDRSALLTALMAMILLSTVVVAGAGNVYYASDIVNEDIENERASLTAAVEGIEGPVYGYNVLASLYVSTDTEPGTMYLGTIYSDELARQKIADIERNNVQYVLVKQYHVSDGRVVTSGYWADSKSTMTEYLNDHYEPVRQTEGYVVLKRTG